MTPRHPELLSLISTTEAIIHTLQATKAKEDEYRQLKLLEARLQFPFPFDTDNTDRQQNNPLSRSRSNSHTYISRPSSTSSASASVEPFRLATRGRKLLGISNVTRLQPSMPTPTRSSIASTSSGGTASCYFSQTPSRQSSFSVSSVSSCPSRNGSLRMSMSMSMSLPMSPKGEERVQLQPTPSTTSLGRSGSDHSHSHSPKTSRSRRNKDELTMFVFDDLVILAQAHEKGGLFTSKTKKERGWRVLPEGDGGVGRVVGVREWEGKYYSGCVL